jgi:hypothetical protein
VRDIVRGHILERSPVPVSLPACPVPGILALRPGLSRRRLLCLGAAKPLAEVERAYVEAESCWRVITPLPRCPGLVTS